MKDLITLPDDANSVEKKIVNYAYANIYGMIYDPMDKFIVAFMFDLGYSPEVTAVATGLSRTSLHRRKVKIKKMLQKLKPNKTLFNDE